MTKCDTITQKRRHYFFLNPYQNAAFTKCPKCDSKTKIRKFPLVIHIDPQQLFLFNKQCRYCTRCDLIIAGKSELESLMATVFEKLNPQIIGNDYLVMGVAERSDWQESKKGKLSEGETIERMIVFKDVWNFEFIPAGWYRDHEH
ncbi:MAG: hypothetical protein KAY65_15140 [Planctomycetes bacterium]|nr:hypothetical protein [Planctomycetota bacterium]